MMTQPELDNLLRIGKLKREPPVQAELEGLLRSGSRRLADAERTDPSLESRFDLAYNAAHALALAALRAKGYRSESRYLVFQWPQHTIDLTRPTASEIPPSMKARWMWTSNSSRPCCGWPAKSSSGRPN